MHRRFLISALICIVGAAPGFSQSRSPNEPSSQLSQKDHQFLAYVVEDNQAEIQLAQLAQKNAQAPIVKELAQQLLDVHQTLGKQLAALVDRLRVEFPTNMGQSLLARLTPKSGVNFDGKFVSAQLEHYRDDVVRFQTEQSNAQNRDLRQFVGSTLPTLRDDLARVQAVDEALGGTPHLAAPAGL